MLHFLFPVHTMCKAFQCKGCGCICHPHCMSYMPENCAPRDGVGVKHDKALLKATSSVIHSGLLFKKGKIVRSWKQRKFVLDTVKGEVNYHCAVICACTCTCTFLTQNASLHLQLSYLEDDRTQGSILIKDITSVDEADPQPGEGYYPFTIGYRYYGNVHVHIQSSPAPNLFACHARGAKPRSLQCDMYTYHCSFFDFLVFATNMT